ncbi:alpha/beta hydrolase family protein [Sulfobacillus thermosulfidooxidans]|uniref:alpha/beta hydrolase family protein n=1 Tax=Sulfobacillus thermosulfidooxidans TaxID=28034 RepID=UPI00096BA30A|nr:alpha/beta fold hydrolase [Sulfobacillus thermosulfidooxidans]OLZ11199.1 hypothetical protein BFX05_07925 [Sulfobacillus thermosulfidooxidans]OLZ13462.1 hypothetical protein BFX06_09840 [Sulfobacillus thermosulfidooxidans]OLZ21709.1 hypothetical protein BFX07_12890 [Sulfobacillus thermosulfidooxidans]
MVSSSLHPSSLTSLCYSPGKHILAYWEIRADLAANQYLSRLHTLNTDTGESRVLTHVKGKPLGLTFGPGDALFDHLGSSLYRVRLNGHVDEIAQFPGSIRSFTIQDSTGLVIVAVHLEPDPQDIWVFRTLPFKRDGQGFLVGQDTLWQLSLSGDSPIYLEAFGGYTHPQLSPVAPTVLALRRTQDVQDLLDTTLVKIHLTTQETIPITAPRAIMAMSWSPNGEHFAVIGKDGTIGTPIAPVLYVGKEGENSLTPLYQPETGWLGASDGADWRVSLASAQIKWVNSTQILVSETIHGAKRLVTVSLSGEHAVLSLPTRDFVEGLGPDTQEYYAISHDFTYFDEVVSITPPTMTALTHHHEDRLCPPEEYWIDTPGQDRVHTFVLEAKHRYRGSILAIHGGPYNAFTHQPTILYHALAHVGFRVIWANPHGSIGYGPEFASSLQGHWGERDEKDWQAIVDFFMDSHTSLDPIGVIGTSYGGYMATWLAGRWPSRIKAAVIQAPVVNQLDMLWASDIGYTFTLEGCQITWDNPDEANLKLWQNSPLRYAHHITCPVLILQGLNDQRCPVSQSSALYTLLKTRNVPTEYVIYPGESHLMTTQGRPKMRQDHFERILHWFDQWME